MKTDVAIIGSGPSGLFLGHLLRQEGISCTIIERQSAEHVLSRIRAGVLETVTTDLMTQLGLDERMQKESMRHDGLTLSINGEEVVIPVTDITGKHVTVYGQTEITRDLIDAAPERGVEIVWEASDVALHDVDRDNPYVTWTKDGETHRLDTTLIAGCDGFHGPSRKAIPDAEKHSYEMVYPFGWLGIMADVPPCHEEVIYASHDDGFALASMRSPTRTRCYVQVDVDDSVENWSDDRFWEEFKFRIGPHFAKHVTTGPSIEKSIAPLRSFVCESMQHGRLFLAGDSAHIVPPTGAKGLNLAASDITYLSRAMISWFKTGESAELEGYSQKALARIWKSERFSWYLTRLLHRFPQYSGFERRMQDAELRYLVESEAAQKTIAENYVGLPL